MKYFSLIIGDKIVFLHEEMVMSAKIDFIDFCGHHHFFMRLNYFGVGWWDERRRCEMCSSVVPLLINS